jgi:hypothetical protein
VGIRERLVALGLAPFVGVVGGCGGGHGNSSWATTDAGRLWADAHVDTPAASGIDASSQAPRDADLASLFDTPCFSDGAAPGPPTMHRAQAVACVTEGPKFGYPDIKVTCATDADCVDAGAAVDLGLKCHQGMCVVDECLADSDCPQGEGCGCADQFYENRCVVFHCHVDADCGPGGFCSPSAATTCNGGALGTFCHVPTDTCINDSDCTCQGGGAVCTYEPKVGHWLCASSDAWCVGP